jgi:hypothetical protein
MVRRLVSALPAVPALALVPHGLERFVILVAIFAGVCLAVAFLIYRLIARHGVAIRWELGRGKFILWFERLPDA